jgi:hypothetical protein
MGVYDEIVKDLKPVPVEDPRYQDKVNKKKDEIRNLAKSENKEFNARFLAEEYSLARYQKDQIEEELKAKNLEIAALEQLLFSSQEAGEEGWGEYGAKENMIRLASGASVAIQKEPTGKVIDKDEFREWCINNGFERELQLHHSTMLSLLKTRLKENLGEMDGVEVYFRPKFVFRR